MNIKNDNIDHLLEILREFKLKEGESTTPAEKQAAITITEFEECIQCFIVEKHIPINIIQAVLINFWVIFEAPFRGVSQYTSIIGQ